MTTLGSILQTSSAGLAAAQTGISTVSNNVANLNTAGYVREVVNQGSVNDEGLGAGVSVSGVVRTANQYLQNTSLQASGVAGAANAVSTALTRPGPVRRPDLDHELFQSAQPVFADFSAAASNPSSSLAAGQAVNDVSQFLNQSQSISASLSNLTTQTDGALSTTWIRSTNCSARSAS